jgi:hypothetical protein
MARQLSSFVIILAIAGAACGRAPVAPDPGPVTLSVKLGQTATTGAVEVAFADLVDSRCPGDATCVVPGDAVVTLDVTVGGMRGRYVVQVNDVTRRRVVHRGMTFELQSVVPYPFNSRPTPRTDYTITVVASQVPLL